ncbi:MAG TPA: alpha/beta hydrolase, partial [Rhizomicrobium sp.]
AARGFRVIRYDNRDAGKSTHLSKLGAPNPMEAMMKRVAGETVTAPYALDDMAQDAASLLGELGVGSAHIVGASMGGMIAQLVAAKHPEHTRSLTSIMSTTGRADLPPGKPEAMAALTTPPASDSREDRIAAGLRVAHALGSPGFKATEEEVRKTVEAAVDRVPMDNDAVARQLMAIVAAPARNDLLKTVKAPSQVIHGADDPILTIEGGKDTAEAIPGAKLHVVPGMAHDFAPKLVPIYIQLIGDFAQSVEKARAA